MRRARRLVPSELMSAPSSNTAPPLGFSSRARVLSKVDFPQALGPMMTVKPPPDNSRSSSDMTSRLP